MKQKLSSPSFVDIFLGQRKVKQTFFQIDTVIDWPPSTVSRKIPRNKTKVGRNVWDKADDISARRIRRMPGNITMACKAAYNGKAMVSKVGIRLAQKGRGHWYLP